MTPILVQQVIEDDRVEDNQDDAVEVEAENGGVEESQEDAVEVEAEGSTDGVLVNGNSSEEQWGTKNEEPSA
jgi:coatomer subunit beta'